MDLGLGVRYDYHRFKSDDDWIDAGNFNGDFGVLEVSYFDNRYRDLSVSAKEKGLDGIQSRSRKLCRSGKKLCAKFRGQVLAQIRKKHSKECLCFFMNVSLLRKILR
ncbi:hypothetical protein [Actinobacillus capsulatus]|uniref:hypothetical protein n=1 Tax=Actinobacillus capsulatus TaxID=717 RepID=UPI000477E88D|nr:hypothetical protein [Actinobacillus capsulatus]